MKLGVFAVLFAQQPLEDALDYICESGNLGAIELGCGAYPGDAHVPVRDLLGSASAPDAFKKRITDRGLVISALSCHGNPIHPNLEHARKDHLAHTNTVRLAERLGVETVVNFSGCPGGGPEDRVPNWITCPWPPDFERAVKWQWNSRLVPYWAVQALILLEKGKRVGFEMHPGFLVFNTQTMLAIPEEVKKLLASGLEKYLYLVEDSGGDVEEIVNWLAALMGEEEFGGKLHQSLLNGVGTAKAGKASRTIGCNFDPSHLFWQGMDPLVSVKALGKAIFHVHAKDCRIDPQNTALTGVLDTKHYGDELNRSWIFRTVGYGHGEEFWRDFVSMLRTVGYDGVLSIEHEDSLMSVNEGFQKAVAFLKSVILTEKTGGMWWA